MYSRPRKGIKQFRSKSKPTTDNTNEEPKFGEYLNRRDWSGAYAILSDYEDDDEEICQEKYEVKPWLAYCYFHLGEYSKAMKIYQRLLRDKKDNKYYLYIACCYYFLQLYKECQEEAEKGPDCSLKNRILIHACDRQGKENEVMALHQKFTSTVEEQLCLASLHFRRAHYQDAVDIYKKILVQNNDYLALHVYVALCYYKIDYSDISQDVLKVYLRSNPKSLIASNLKACNAFKMVSGKQAEEELQKIIDLQNSSFSNENMLVKHNMVVFKDGEGSLRVLPNLVDIIPEARLNLVIYYLRIGESEKAYEYIKDVDPVKASEYILKGVVYTTIGQKEDSRDYLKRAQQYYRLIGASDTECDTIPGRQCMASCFFLNKQFDDVLIYMKSIEEFLDKNSSFHWNFGIARAASGLYKEAEEELLKVEDPKFVLEFPYLAWLARCFVLNGKPSHAWELYLKMESNEKMRDLILIIANDCYRAGHFWYAAKAFDILERLDPNPDYWAGKRGSCVGCFQQIIAGKRNSSTLGDIAVLLSNSKKQEVEHIINVMKKWADKNNVGFDL